MIPYETALAAFKATSAELGKPWQDCEEQAECLRRLILWAIRSPEYAGRLTAGILLRGHRDSGKTHAMKCLRGMLNKIHGNRGYGNDEAFTIRVCQELATRYNIEGDEAMAEMAGGLRVMFDDLGEERDGNFMGKPCNVMAEILGIRYRKMQERAMLTMFTTNIPNDVEMAKKYGERIATRINEMCDVILWKGPKDGFRKKTAPLAWTWPGSPQEQAATDEQRRVSDAQMERWRKEQTAAHEERQRKEAEEAARRKQVELETHRVGIEQMPLDTLVMAMQTHPDKDVKLIYRTEIQRRSKAPVEEIMEFLTTPVMGIAHMAEPEQIPEIVTNAMEVTEPKQSASA